MKVTLRITLIFSFLIFFIRPANAVVNHQENIENIVSKKNKLSLKRILKKGKKRISSIKSYWENKVIEKKKFGKIGSITLFVLLSTAAFTVLKLTGVIAWSWFWVLSPLIFYVSLILLAVIIGIFAVLALRNANE